MGTVSSLIFQILTDYALGEKLFTEFLCTLELLSLLKNRHLSNLKYAIFFAKKFNVRLDYAFIPMQLN